MGTRRNRTRGRTGGGEGKGGGKGEGKEEGERRENRKRRSRGNRGWRDRDGEVTFKLVLEIHQRTDLTPTEDPDG